MLLYKIQIQIRNLYIDNLKPALQLQHLRIDPFLFHEFRMISSLDDRSVFKDYDIVRFFNGLESMCDDDDCTSFEEIMEGDIDLFF